MPPPKKIMKTALFTNFTDQEFIGYWDGKGKRFAPGMSLFMPDYLAKHFAKHLVNRELLRTDKKGNLVYPNGEKLTSPKKPEESPIFMELFNKAYQPDETEELGDKKDDIETLINVANKNRVSKQSIDQTTPEAVEKPSKNKVKQDPTKPQVIIPADFDSDDE